MNFDAQLKNLQSPWFKKKFEYSYPTYLKSNLNILKVRYLNDLILEIKNNKPKNYSSESVKKS